LGRDEPSAVDAIHVARRIVPRGAPAGVLVEDVVAVPSERPWSRFNASLASSSRWYQGCLASAAASRANDRRDRRRRRRSRRKGWVIQPRYRHREATTVTRVGRAPLSGRRGAAFARDVAFELCAPPSQSREPATESERANATALSKSPQAGVAAPPLLCRPASAVHPEGAESRIRAAVRCTSTFAETCSSIVGTEFRVKKHLRVTRRSSSQKVYIIMNCMRFARPVAPFSFSRVPNMYSPPNRNSLVKS
jgi:hypothetical protein